MIFQENISLSGLNTFKVGGNARYFCVVKTIDELKKALFFAKEDKLPFFILGGGSNTLFSDEGFDGLIIKMEILRREIEQDSKNEIKLSLGVGENWDELVSFAVENHFYGIENLSGIPGTVGGAVVQNIGAYGAEVGDSIIEVEILDASNMKTKILNRKECLFSYRSSIFKKQEGGNYIVTRVLLRLIKDGKLNTNYKDIGEYLKNIPLHHSNGCINPDSVNLKSLRSAVLEIRAKKFPDLNFYGTAGSFFKNLTVNAKIIEKLREKYPQIPSYYINGENFRIPLAWVLDNVCKFKGFRKGKVGLYENQPLVLINFGGASSDNIKKFADEIALRVKEKVGIDIEVEVVFA